MVDGSMCVIAYRTISGSISTLMDSGFHGSPLTGMEEGHKLHSGR